MTTIGNNLQTVRMRIAAACAMAQRPADSVTLLAVSKTHGADAVRAAHAAGQRAFGENYVQEGVDKIAQLADLRHELEWHCIGPIQANKTRLVAEHFDWAQSVDRLRIAERLSSQRPAHLPPLSVCIQVNLDGSPTKAGVAPAEALALAQAVAALPRIRLRGLMAIPDDAMIIIANEPVFTWAKRLFDQVSAGLPSIDTLSLGMTADIEPAVQAGSTMVRVGTAIFGGREPRAVWAPA